MNKNIHYKTDEIAHFFSFHRNKWKEFYPSERWILKRIGGFNRGRLGRVLDVGCARGGLGLALSEKFALDQYVGVDINKQAIDFAKNTKFPFPCQFECEDILRAKHLKGKFDCVASLSCADWNIETERIIKSCWQRVRKGKFFVISLRLTPAASLNDIKKSYQYIWYKKSKPPKRAEIANYVVFNAYHALDILSALRPKPSLILGYGYWGKPSLSARTPFNKLVFTVFAVRKSNSEKEKTKYELHWPLGGGK